MYFIDMFGKLFGKEKHHYVSGPTFRNMNYEHKRDGSLEATDKRTGLRYRIAKDANGRPMKGVDGRYIHIRIRSEHEKDFAGLNYSDPRFMKAVGRVSNMPNIEDEWGGFEPLKDRPSDVLENDFVYGALKCYK